MAWATTTHVSDITGVTVTAPQLAQAIAVIEIHVGRTTDADDAASVRDLYWLKQAVCWQAVWQKEQAGYTTRNAVQRMSQDGMTVEMPSASAVLLAPLAIRAIKNLSWMGSRSVAVTAAPTAPPAFNVETSDVTHDWLPL